MKTNITGWRGISKSAETTQGLAATVDISLAFAGDPLDREPDKTYKNDDEVTGQRVSSKSEITRYKLAGSHKQKAMPQNLAFFLAMAMGSVVSSQPDATGAPNTWEHLITYLNDDTGILLPTRTIRENDGISDKEYKGVACKSIEISGQKGEHVEMVANLLGLGNETIEASGTYTKPSTVLESYLNYSDVNLRKGGTWDPVAKTITGGTALEAKLKNFKFNFDNGATPEFAFGDNSKAATEIRAKGRLTTKLEAEFEIDDESHKTDLEAGTEFALIIPIVGTTIEGTYNYTVEFLFPRCKYAAAKKGTDDGMMKVGSEIELLASPDNAVYVRIINKIAQIL